MISRVRFDDVLWKTSDKKMKGREVHQITKYVNWCKNLSVPLSPAILCQDIEKIPGGVDYIKDGIESELFFPDLHGWDHGAYGEREQSEIEEHLEKAMEWFDRNLNVEPFRWVTPHGANSYAIQAAARKFNLVVETTDYPVIDQKKADNLLRETRDLTYLNGRVIMTHWWERGLRLYRIAKVLEHGTVDAAITASGKELDERSWKICWDKW